MKNIRESMNMTQQELASKSCVSRVTISRIENGKFLPSVDVAKRIAEVLNFDWTLFFK